MYTDHPDMIHLVSLPGICAASCVASQAARTRAGAEFLAAYQENCSPLICAM